MLAGAAAADLGYSVQDSTQSILCCFAMQCQQHLQQQFLTCKRLATQGGQAPGAEGSAWGGHAIMSTKAAVMLFPLDVAGEHAPAAAAVVLG